MGTNRVAAPATTPRSIADAFVLKDGDLFLLTESDGRIPVENDHGFGLYHHDCRYLNAYELRLCDTYSVVLGSTAEAGGTGVFGDLDVGRNPCLGETRSSQREGAR
jgi:hypothetical protein